ncbi:MAG: hypothetical protein QF368_00795 [SAR202 cluster bacterium]|jgi:epoxyqueuosine reductase QueG|nr:hypothetical protein [SAR202 cluster bacterium]
MSVESQIKDSALGLGFDLVGITTAEPFERDEQAASQRVRDGLMDGLPWYNLERVHRMNRPLVLLEGARSVISLAVSYNTSSDASVGKSRNEQTSARLTGKIAR